jgi:DNA repair protein RecN (Recombination protein N)
MPNVRFNIQVISNLLYNNGKDELQFLFSANKGTDFGLLKKVASGGDVPNNACCKAILARYSNYLR